MTKSEKIKNLNSILSRNMIYQESRTAAMIWDINRGLEPMGNRIG